MLVVSGVVASCIADQVPLSAPIVTSYLSELSVNSGEGHSYS